PRRDGRLHGPPDQDDRPPARRGEVLRPPRPEPESEEGPRPDRAIREEGEQGRPGRSGRLARGLPRGHDRPLGGRRQERRGLRLRPPPRLRPRGGLDRGGPHDGEGARLSDRLPRPLPPRARLPRPERELRLGPGARRDDRLREVLRTGRRDAPALNGPTPEV